MTLTAPRPGFFSGFADSIAKGYEKAAANATNAYKSACNAYTSAKNNISEKYIQNYQKPAVSEITAMPAQKTELAERKYSNMAENELLRKKQEFIEENHLHEENLRNIGEDRESVLYSEWNILNNGKSSDKAMNKMMTYYEEKAGHAFAKSLKTFIHSKEHIEDRYNALFKQEKDRIASWNLREYLANLNTVKQLQYSIDLSHSYIKSVIASKLARYAPIAVAAGLAAGCAPTLDNDLMAEAERLTNTPRPARSEKRQTISTRYPVSIPDKTEFDSSISEAYTKQIHGSMWLYACGLSEKYKPKGRADLSGAEKKELRKSIKKFHDFCEEKHNMKGMVLTAEALDDNSRYFGWSGDPKTVGDKTYNENPVLSAVLENDKWNIF
ncbi:MAG: hypothetical protein HZB65_00690 [Candidatus Aenigmarchaeota archaeon]|nr:hypothetical protein [Candidatus Aenigmarchaeota archaeon]